MGGGHGGAAAAWRRRSEGAAPCQGLGSFIGGVRSVTWRQSFDLGSTMTDDGWRMGVGHGSDALDGRRVSTGIAEWIRVRAQRQVRWDRLTALTVSTDAGAGPATHGRRTRATRPARELCSRAPDPELLLV
jgi:hypothetical protein